MSRRLFYTKDRGAFLIDDESKEYFDIINSDWYKEERKETDRINDISRKRRKLKYQLLHPYPRPIKSKLIKTKQPKLIKTRDKQFCYFVKSNEYVKIGTTKNLTGRINQIKTYNPYKLELLYTTTNYSEWELHQKFKYLKINGEWFKYTDEIKNFIEQDKNT